MIFSSIINLVKEKIVRNSYMAMHRPLGEKKKLKPGTVALLSSSK